MTPLYPRGSGLSGPAPPSSTSVCDNKLRGRPGALEAASPPKSWLTWVMLCPLTPHPSLLIYDQSATITDMNNIEHLFHLKLWKQVEEFAHISFRGQVEKSKQRFPAWIESDAYSPLTAQPQNEELLGTVVIVSIMQDGWKDGSLKRRMFYVAETLSELLNHIFCKFYEDGILSRKPFWYDLYKRLTSPWTIYILKLFWGTSSDVFRGHTESVFHHISF